jgi:hypothetical protein
LDDQQAVVLFRKAAEQGEAAGQNLLGMMYGNGRGIPKDDQQALMWYRKAAEQGFARSQSILGRMYRDGGQGVTKDEQQSMFWYRKAAEQGYADAQYNLGLMYFGTDDRQAVLWYRKAAEQGNADAQFMLSVMYGAGSGVPKDEQMEYFWLLLASSQGNQSAIKVRAEVERHLLPEQRAAAQASARTWQPIRTSDCEARFRVHAARGQFSEVNDDEVCYFIGSFLRSIHGEFCLCRQSFCAWPRHQKRLVCPATSRHKSQSDQAR